MRKVHSIIALGVCCLILLLGGCVDMKLPFLANDSSQPSTPQAMSDSHEAERLLQYYRSLKSLPENKLRWELDHARKAAAKETARFERMQLILLLLLSKEPIQGRKQAQVLLQDFLKTENADNMESLHNLALLLQGLLIEDARQKHRYRLLKEKLTQKEEKIERLMSRLKHLDGRRKQGKEWATSLKQQLRNERGRTETLESQLEAIKTIEKRLKYRSQPKETLKLPEQSKVLDE